MHENELKLLRALKGEFEDCRLIALRAGVDYNAAMSALVSLEEQKFAEATRSGVELVSLSDEGKRLVAEGVPERKLLSAIEKRGKCELQDAIALSGLSALDGGIALPQAAKNRWIRIEKDAHGKTILIVQNNARSRVEDALAEINAGEVPLGSVHADALKELVARRLAKKREEKTVQVRATALGLEAARAGAGDAVAQLSPEMLVSGSWRGKQFRKYDANAPTPAAYVAKKNPLRAFSDEVRSIFLQMGFKEIKGPIVECSFWNFDALFVPQDHPSRELQDTFFVKHPQNAKGVEKEFEKSVSAAHENGGNTGSRGWGYKWNEKVALQNVLRTHTTNATCRMLAVAAKEGKFPVKVFSIDRVFRNEAIDFKHLAEFHQVEGIIIDDSANLNDLVGVLKAFFAKLGFSKVRVRPGYFPYTEPSAEVDIWFEERGEWLELGGAGIFRPEVTRPLGITQNVLAWGLSLERPLMLREKLGDIRTFYRNDLDWIRREK